jgi:flavin-dependent dehydrogenase
MSDRFGIAIVGGGPAGAALAARLADAGEPVVVLERSPAWHWRAGGVFSSPAAMAALRRAGLTEAALAGAARPIPAMRVETPGGATFRLTYGADAGGEPAVGFDRCRLDTALLDLAERAGAEIRRGWAVTGVELDGGGLAARAPDGEAHELQADVLVGADGLRSVVARAAGVDRPVHLAPRVGLTYHLEDPEPDHDAGPRDDRVRDARMRVLQDGYVGIAPVPGGRVNVGIVLGRTWHRALARDGARSVAASIVAAIPPTEDDPVAWRDSDPIDRIEGAWPLGHRVTQRAGPTWLLIGDAAGFLDPFTGEGIHRALVSAELAAAAILAGRRGRGTTTAALAAYDRAMQRRFLAKDAVSWMVQSFLARPWLFEYAAHRVAARPPVRATMGLVMGDLVPASRALDPRYLAALLAP